MSLALVPRTQNADYAQLTEAQQTRFDELMNQADSTISAAIYNTLMAAAADLAGITGAEEVARCACPHCGTCPTVFDTALAGIRACGTNDGYNLPQLQCPDCSDRHPAVVEQ